MGKIKGNRAILHHKNRKVFYMGNGNTINNLVKLAAAFENKIANYQVNDVDPADLEKGKKKSEMEKQLNQLEKVVKYHYETVRRKTNNWQDPLQMEWFSYPVGGLRHDGVLGKLTDRFKKFTEDFGPLPYPELKRFGNVESMFHELTEKGFIHEHGT